MEKEKEFLSFLSPFLTFSPIGLFLSPLAQLALATAGPLAFAPFPCLPFLGRPSSARRPLPCPFPLPATDSLGPAVSVASHLQPFHVACRQGGTAAPLRVVGASSVSSVSRKEGQTPSCPPLQFSSSLETVAPNHSNREDRELASHHCSSFIISGSSPPRLKSW